MPLELTLEMGGAGGEFLPPLEAPQAPDLRGCEGIHGPSQADEMRHPRRDDSKRGAGTRRGGGPKAVVRATARPSYDARRSISAAAATGGGFFTASQLTAAAVTLRNHINWAPLGAPTGAPWPLPRGP